MSSGAHEAHGRAAAAAGEVQLSVSTKRKHNDRSGWALLSPLDEHVVCCSYPVARSERWWFCRVWISQYSTVSTERSIDDNKYKIIIDGV